MYRWFAIAPLVLLAACSHSNVPPAAVAQNAPAAQTAAPPPVGNPEPVDRSAAAVPPAPMPAAAPASVPEAAPAPRPEVVVPRGTALRVRLDDGLDTRRNHSGDGFSATLVRPVVVRGAVLIPEGTRFRGHVTEAAASGRLEGRPVLAVTLDSFHAQGREFRIRTSQASRVGPRHKKRNMFLIGGGTGLGAALGAIAGGGKGAAIGALAGAGAGTAGAAATGKEQVALPAESALVFTMQEPVRM